MKTYQTATQLRIVGKAYEVRWMLRRMLETALHPYEPLFHLPAAQDGLSSNVIPFPAGGQRARIR